MCDGRQLLAEYAETGSEAAFRELVSNYVDLVYSAALRLVNGDAHLAEDVTQIVFADLARMGRRLSRDVMLGGWLHRHTCFVAGKVMRGERRRRERERRAVEMNEMEDHSAANLALVAPTLDEAINELGSEDRAAILLRFFEHKDFRSVGDALGSNEEAARKRVNRALEKLNGLLRRRGVTLSTAALASTLATQVVGAAPAGLAVSVSSVALAGAAGGGTALTLFQLMSMTKLKVGIISAAVIASASVPLVLQQQQKAKLNAANIQLKQQLEQNQELLAENQRLSNLLAEAKATAPAPAPNPPSMELLRLRNEVSRLRQENASVRATRTNVPSALSGLKAKPEMWKMLRDQQKMGLSLIYKKLANEIKLDDEKSGEFSDLLADNVMENIDHITAILAEKQTPEQAEALLATQEALLKEKVRAMLGEEGYARYHEYTKNLASAITAEQFKGKFTGEKEEQEARAKQFYQLLQEETQRTLSSAGLPADYQLVPTLNFRNFAWESEAEKNLQLLDGIYERASAAASFLNPEELASFNEFRKMAVNNNRMILSVNRQFMSPGAQ